MSSAVASVSESELSELAWNDLKKLAKEVGVAVKGTREDITSEILTNGNSDTLIKSAKKQPLGGSSISFNLMNSPKLTAPKTAGKSTKKSYRKTPAPEKVVFEFPTDDEDEVKDNEENAEPKELFLPGFTTNAGGPVSPQIKQRAGRKPVLRSPSPIKSPLSSSVASPPAATTAKGRTPIAKSTRKATTAKKAASRRSIAAAEEVAPEPEAKATLFQDDAKEVEITAPAVAEEVPAAATTASSPGLIVSDQHLKAGIGAYLLALIVGIWFGMSSSSSSSPFNALDSIKLAGANPLQVVQGSEYVEMGLEMAPLEALVTGHQLSAPKVSFEYSDSGVAFSDYLAEVGEFTVAYTVTADWLENGYLTLHRTVEVTDVDECTYAGTVEAFKAKCADTSQSCVNTHGGYECQ